MADADLTLGDARPVGAPLRSLARQARVVAQYLGGREHVTRARAFYEAHHEALAGSAGGKPVDRWLNYGYWSPGVADPAEAGAALADVLAEAAGITDDDEVLDAGFGYGEQDLRWARRWPSARVVGVNIVESQVREARARVAAAGLDDRVDLRVASATDLPFAAATVDRVVALESAFHFPTRRDFLDEALRVLRPGGTIAVADIVDRDDGPRDLLARLERFTRGRVVPRANRITAPRYAEQLEQAGFADVSVRVISEQTFGGSAAHLRALADAAPRGRTGATARRQAWLAERLAQQLDYLVAVGRRP